MIQRVVDEIVTVSEPELAEAVGGLVEREHLIAEGAGAVGTAAIVARKVGPPAAHLVVVLTGSNIDRARLTQVLSGSTRI